MLLKREPFEKILPQTLIDFFFRQGGTASTVKWQNDKNGNWLINARLNVIFVSGANPIVFTQAKNEFSRSIVWWKRILQKLYVQLATAKRTARFFASASLVINPQLSGAKNIAIIGGNHHIRLLDYNNNCAYVISKTGFGKQFLSNEITLRQTYSFLPIPRLLEIAPDKTWYSEELIGGIPLNRLPESNKKSSALTQIEKSLDELYRNTRQNIYLKTYLEQLTLSILKNTTGNLLLSDDQRETIQDELFNVLKFIKSRTLHNDKPFTLAQTHGDLQPGNILVDTDKAWLIDWEYTGQRQITFDYFVFHLAARSPKNLNRRFFRQYAQYNSDPAEKLKLLIFTLEELDLRLKEINNFQFTSINAGLILYLDELQKIIHFL